MDFPVSQLCCRRACARSPQRGPRRAVYKFGPLRRDKSVGWILAQGAVEYRFAGSGSSTVLCRRPALGEHPFFL